MLNRKWLFGAAIAAAAGIPYVALDENMHSSVSNFTGGLITSEEKPTVDASLDLQQPQGAGQGDVRPTLSGPQVSDFGEVFRFDVSPAWVTQRWSRVSSSLAELQMEGMRVPLVTGAKSDDVTGTLTYYFDKQQNVQRITFVGTTGDPARFVSSIAPAFYLTEKKSFSKGMYVGEWNGEPTRMLLIRHGGVIRSAQERAGYQIHLEVNQGRATNYRLSQPFKALYDQEMGSGRTS